MCQLSYSHILYLENFPFEWEMFLSDNKIKEKIKLPWNNKSQDKRSQKYIPQLTKKEKEHLYKKYEADFKMFGYSIDDEF